VASRVGGPLRTVDSGKRGRDGRGLTAMAAGGRRTALVRIAWSRGRYGKEGWHVGHGGFRLLGQLGEKGTGQAQDE
jgi:hypothetical protein